MKERIQQSVKILAPIGTLGGFISDVLTPLGPVTKWLFFCSLFISILFLIFYVLNKKKLAQKYLPSSIILALVFGVFFLLNNNTEKVFLVITQKVLQIYRRVYLIFKRLLIGLKIKLILLIRN